MIGNDLVHTLQGLSVVLIDWSNGNNLSEQECSYNIWKLLIWLIITKTKIYIIKIHVLFGNFGATIVLMLIPTCVRIKISI